MGFPQALPEKRARVLNCLAAPRQYGGQTGKIIPEKNDLAQQISSVLILGSCSLVNLLEGLKLSSGCYLKK